MSVCVFCVLVVLARVFSLLTGGCVDYVFVYMEGPCACTFQVRFSVHCWNCT